MPITHNRIFALCFLSLLCAVPAKAAKNPPASNPAAERLKALEQQAAESRARADALAQRTLRIEKELAAQRQSLTDQAAQVRIGEETVSRVEQEQTSLAARFSQESESLGADRARLVRLTAGLTRLARIPPGGLLVSSDAPVDAARAQLLIGSALAATEDALEQARQELARLDDLGRQLEAKRREGEHAENSLKSRQSELALLVEKRQSLYVQTESDRKTEAERAEKIADEAKDLRDLMARIEAEEEAETRAAKARLAEAQRKAHGKTQAAAPAGHFSAGAGLPVAGQVKIRFGQNDGLGATSHGVTLAARPGAAVTAPSAGVVRFAGPFRGYREILILEHPGGYHSLIAGMSRINVAVGTSVGDGEPVGTMDERPDAKPELYYELRHNGQFVDPEAQSLRVDVPRGVPPRVDVKGKSR